MTALKERKWRSGTSTAAASPGSGGIGGLQTGKPLGLGWRTFRLELKGCREWTDVRGSAIGMDEVGLLVSAAKTRMPMILRARFDWDAH